MGYTVDHPEPQKARATYGDGGAGVFAKDSMVVHGLVYFDLYETSLDGITLREIPYGLFDVAEVALVRDWIEEKRLIYS